MCGECNWSEKCDCGNDKWKKGSAKNIYRCTKCDNLKEIHKDKSATELAVINPSSTLMGKASYRFSQNV